MRDVALLEMRERLVTRERERQVRLDDLLERVAARVRAPRGGAREIAEGDEARDGVAKLAHVPGPVVVLQPAHQISGERRGVAAELLPEARREERDVRAPSA